MTENMAGEATGTTIAARIFAWGVTFVTFAFLINNILTFWFGFPGFLQFVRGNGGATALGLIQALIYLAALAGAVILVLRDTNRSLRLECLSLYAVTAYIIRASFWAVLLVGLADMTVSFLRVEGLLPTVFGEDLAKELGRSAFRGPFVHYPLIVVAMIIAALTRSLAFIWLALLVVVAELLIVFARFIFSYEQAFMGDLVRFWYGALFLFASAYTLIEEGHVRVDVLYSGFQDRNKGLVNMVGSVVLGILLCVVILATGMWGKSNVINSPLLSYEVSQSGFGMYVKYLMSGFLAIFAVSMMVQFCGYFLEGLADYRGDPDKRKLESDPVH